MNCRRHSQAFLVAVVVLAGLAGRQVAEAGLVTSATVTAIGGGTSNNCTQAGGGSNAACSAALSSAVAGTAQASASYGSVSSSIQGGAYSFNSSVDVLASATFTDTLTIFGSSGTGLLTLNELLTTVGTGSLGSGAGTSQNVSSTMTFTFGVPFDITLTVQADGSFLGAYGDGGSLDVTRALVSMSIADLGGNTLSGLTWSDASGASYTFTSGMVRQPLAMPLRTANTGLNTPEPASWMLGLLGLGFIVLGRYGIGRRRRPR